MYREEVYRTIAREFASGIGVATTFRITEVAGDPHVERSREDRIKYRAVQDEWRINRVVVDAIGKGKYRELVRSVFRIGREHPDWSRRRCYTTAWTGIIGRKSPKRNKTLSV